MTVTLRRALATDADILRDVFSQASEGLADYFWQSACGAGQTIDEVARARMAAKIADPTISIWIAEADGAPAGGIVSYVIGPEPQPTDGLSAMMRSFVGLENDARGTRYVNAIAVFPGYRRQGLARRMIAQTRSEARGLPLSLAVSDANPEARALYASVGFAEYGRYPMVKEGWNGSGTEWILLKTPD